MLEGIPFRTLAHQAKFQSMSRLHYIRIAETGQNLQRIGKLPRSNESWLQEVRHCESEAQAVTGWPAEQRGFPGGNRDLKASRMSVNNQVSTDPSNVTSSSHDAVPF